MNLRPQTLREDRILDEVRATGGDVRRICELFGLSVEGALRYTSTLDHSDIGASSSESPQIRFPQEPISGSAALRRTGRRDATPDRRR